MMDDDDSVSSVSDGSSSPSDIADGVPGSDDATETSSKSWFEKIIDSLKAIVFGLIIVVGSGVLMFWNEGRSAQTAASLAEGAGLVQSVNSDKLDPALDGKLIHVAAPATTARPIRDPDFGVEANGLILARKVEMYQWKEDKKSETRKKLGGGEETVTTYSYSKEWSDKAVDSSRFRNASDHRNSAMPRTLSHEFKAPDAKLGAFALNERVLGLLSASEALEAQPSALTQARAVLGQSAQVRQGTVYAGANPDQPAIGDVRVTWRLLPLTDISVVARQTQATFAPFLTSNGREVLLAETGVQPAALMFKHGQETNALLTWILRGVGLLLMFIGFRLMLTLLEVLGDLIPFVGDLIGAGASLLSLLATLIVAPVIIAFAWFFYRPLVAVGALLVGGALVVGVRTLMRKRVAAARPASMTPAVRLRASLPVRPWRASCLAPLNDLTEPGNAWSRRLRRLPQRNQIVVGVADEVISHRTLPMRQFEARLALGPHAQRNRVHHRIEPDKVVDIRLHLVDAFDGETDVIDARRHDALADIIVDAPGNDDERHAPVAEIMIGIAVRGVLLGKFENIHVEARHLVGPHGSDRHMADVPGAGDAGVLDIGAGAIFHVFLREIEDVAVRVVRGDAGERPVRRPLNPAGDRVFRAHLVEAGLHIFDLDAEMIEPRRSAALARIDVEPDVTIADVDARLRPRRLRRFQAEQQLIEAVEQRVFLADDGDVINFGEHVSSGNGPVSQLPLAAFSQLPPPAVFMASRATRTMSAGSAYASAMMRAMRSPLFSSISSLCRFASARNSGSLIAA